MGSKGRVVVIGGGFAGARVAHEVELVWRKVSTNTGCCRFILQISDHV